MPLQGMVAIVTGSTKGIGLAIARALVGSGADVCVSGRHEEEVEKAVQQLNDIDEGRVTGVVCDMRSEEEVRSLVEHTVEEFGGLDILINNAGIPGEFVPVAEMTPDNFRAVLETNLFGVFYACHAAIPEMKKRGGGYIINISSLAGTNAHPQMSAYNASKFGLNGFSEALMQEVRYDGIKVSYVMPGSVNTDFGRKERSGDHSWQLQPDDIARVVVDLLHHDERSLPSRIEIRPASPPKK